MLLRLPRTVTALVTTGTAAVVLALTAAPAGADQVRAGEWWLRPLGVTASWSASKGAGVTVAVLSDGVASVPDLAGAVQSVKVSGAPVAAGKFFGKQGTPAASLIAGRGHGPDGGSGIIGVAPQARILSVPVTLPADDPASQSAAIPAAIAAGIRAAVADGAKVIDLPLDLAPPAGGSPAERSAVSYAVSHNAVVVAPAGDNAQSGGAINWPAGYPGVIAVGAVNSKLALTPTSSRRSYVALTGPGADVIAATAAGGYQSVSSTAAASAVVAGVAALIRSQYPGLTVAQVRQALISTSEFGAPKLRSGGLGYGTVNATEALTVAAATAAPQQDHGGAGAQPTVTPAPMPASAPAPGLLSQVVRAAEISAALLVVLLALVALYTLVRRRRSRRKATPGTSLALAAGWSSGHPQSRYPVGSLTEGDRMLDVFAAPLADPSAARRGDSAPGRLASGPRSQPGLFAPAGPAAEPEPAPRRPVSGTPPWSLASAPASDPAWPGDAPDPQTVAGQVLADGYPAAGDHYTAAADRGRRLAGRGNGQPAAGDTAGLPSRASAVRARLGRLTGRGRAGAGTDAPLAATGGGDDSGRHPSGLPVRQPRAVPTGRTAENPPWRQVAGPGTRPSQPAAAGSSGQPGSGDSGGNGGWAGHGRHSSGRWDDDGGRPDYGGRPGYDWAGEHARGGDWAQDGWDGREVRQDSRWPEGR